MVRSPIESNSTMFKYILYLNCLSKWILQHLCRDPGYNIFQSLKQKVIHNDCSYQLKLRLDNKIKSKFNLGFMEKINT